MRIKWKNITLIMIFLVLLCFMGAVNATENVTTDTLKSDNYDTVTTHTIDEDLNEKISTEPTKTLNKDKDRSINTETKSFENTVKTEHNSETLKSGKTVNVNNYTELIDEMNNAVSSEDEEYTINLNSGSYKAQDIVTLASGTYQPKIIINGNKQELSGTIDSTKITINNNCNIYINNLIINTLNIENSANLYFINCSLTSNQITNTGQISIINSTSKTDIQINDGTVNVENSTLGGKISVKKNKGTLIIGEDVDFDSNLEIINDGTVNTNNPDKILLYLKNIKGNYVISDTSITKTHNFDGAITLNNCTITSTNNRNYGTLTLNNCTVNVGADNTFLTNANKVYISKDTIINGKINDPNNGVIYEGAAKTYIVNSNTLNFYFDNNGHLSSRVNPGDTLDIQGKIILRNSLIIDKAVNIISSTKDGYIDLNTTGGSYFGEDPGNCFVINKEGAYTNITGIYFHNTQLWLYNTNYVILDNINVVVENQRVGSGVGVTSIRQNSSYITVKNSHFYTKDNEGSSTLVLAWADYCTIENNTIIGVGTVGNLLYFTTYNVNIPQGIIYNSHNKVINNTLHGPSEPLAICYGICISGYDNIVDNNTITYSGTGITFQWGSGVTGIEQDESLVGSGGNIVRNNKLYGGCGIDAGDLIYDNYINGILSVPKNSRAYNNTAKGLEIGGNYAEVTDNTITGSTTFRVGVSNAVIENNTITGIITIPATSTHNLIKNNNIKGRITLDGSFNNITDNTIITDSEYTIYSNKMGKSNKVSDNYLLGKSKGGDLSVDLRDESNIIKNNIPVNTKVELISPSETIVNQTVSITIRLTDAKGNLIKDAQALISSNNRNETILLTNGTYTYTYTPRSIGEDTITVKYDGNYTLLPNTNSKTIKVSSKTVTPTQGTDTTKPPVTKQQTSTSKNSDNKISITIAKSPKTVSKKAKKLTLTATVKMGKKAVPKKIVRFIIQGKTYKVKTNMKGVAKLTLKKKQLTKILKKVKVGKKLKIQIRYGKTSITKYLKVKK